jgi:leucyl aminopeptidase
MDTLELYPGGNAECISEIVAHIMCEQIARNIRNEGEEKLTPAELADMAQNIANHYSEEQLAKPITRI